MSETVGNCQRCGGTLGQDTFLLILNGHDAYPDESPLTLCSSCRRSFTRWLKSRRPLPGASDGKTREARSRRSFSRRRWRRLLGSRRHSAIVRDAVMLLVCIIGSALAMLFLLRSMANRQAAPPEMPVSGARPAPGTRAEKGAAGKWRLVHNQIPALAANAPDRKERRVS